MDEMYAIHPGWVKSYMDGDEHYIGYMALIKLYGLNPANCVLWDQDSPQTFAGRKWKDYKHFFPTSNGQYGNKQGKDG